MLERLYEDMVTTITVADLARKIDDNEQFALIDTRDKESYEAWHAPGALHFRFVPTDDLNGQLDAFRDLVGETRDIVTICGKGISSGTLAAKLVNATDEYDVSAVQGGMEFWSRLYHHVPLDVGPELTVVQIQRRAKGCLGYLLADPETNTGVVIDPTGDIEEFIRAAGEHGVRIEGVIDTHVHADHVSGARDLATRLDVPYYMSEHAASRDLAFEYEPLADGSTLAVGTVDLDVYHTPGHTTDMITLVADRVAFTADTLHVDSVGRTELEFGDENAADGAQMLYQSLHETILELPDDTIVCPGHVGVGADGTYSVGHPRNPITTTIGAARESIDALSLSEAAFVDRLSDGGTKPANYEEILERNRGHEITADNDRLTLEIGPNNCSA